MFEFFFGTAVCSLSRRDDRMHVFVLEKSLQNLLNMSFCSNVTYDFSTVFIVIIFDPTKVGTSKLNDILLVVVALS